jgi:hypothetical protein
MERVVEDIVFDFSVKPRLASERGNAMLVASSIYEAAKYFELFQKTVFKGRCALVTSYNPQERDSRGNRREYGDRKAVSFGGLHVRTRPQRRRCESGYMTASALRFLDLRYRQTCVPLFMR